MRKFKLLISTILVLLIICLVILFVTAWKMAEDTSGTTYWQEYDLGENGEVLFYGEPELVWTEEYSVWDMLKFIINNIDNIKDISNLFDPKPLVESPF